VPKDLCSVSLLRIYARKQRQATTTARLCKPLLRFAIDLQLTSSWIASRAVSRKLPRRHSVLSHCTSWTPPSAPLHTSVLPWLRDHDNHSTLPPSFVLCSRVAVMRFEYAIMHPPVVLIRTSHIFQRFNQPLQQLLSPAPAAPLPPGGWEF
jgi:hypothetical protein